MKDNLTFHTAIYSSSSLLVAIAGLISFPIMTRVFSAEEYGILNLISLAVMFLVALGKAGLQRSIVRFGSEARSGRVEFKEADVYLTALVGMFCVVVVLQLVWSVGSQFIPLSLIQDPRIYPIFIICGVLAICQTVYSGLSNIFVSEKKSVILSTFEVVKRYIGIAFIIGGFWLFADNLYRFYIVTGLHEALFCVLLLLLCQRYFGIFGGRISLPLGRQLFLFGLPLVGHELLTHLFSYGDRVLINYFLGPAQLGYYAAAYNLCVYIKSIFVASLMTAVTPMYMDCWDNEGRAETEKFLALTLRYYLLLAIPTTVGITAIGEDLIGFLAGEKYAAAHGVLPWVILGMLVDGGTAVAAAGLQLAKRTGLMMSLMGGATVLNIVLNLILIPLFGIEGAAMATLGSYLFFAGASWYFGRAILTIRTDIRPVMAYVAAALVMYGALLGAEAAVPGINVFLQIGLGAAVFTIAALLLDQELRQLVGRYAGPAWTSVAHRLS